MTPTADPASRNSGQRSIIEKHKYDETPCPYGPVPAAAELSSQQKQKRRQTVKSGAFRNMGWTMGIEPTTTGVTIPCSTN